MHKIGKSVHDKGSKPNVSTHPFLRQTNVPKITSNIAFSGMENKAIHIHVSTESLVKAQVSNCSTVSAAKTAISIVNLIITAEYVF